MEETYKPIVTPKEPRVRTNLTSIQLDKTQKQTIDQAYSLFVAESEMFVSKGQFIEGLAQDFMRKKGSSIEPVENFNEI